MNPKAEYIKRLTALQEGDLSTLRRLAGQPLDASLQGFDIFTGLWWPLREKSPKTPRREPSWLVAKLFATFRVPHIRPDSDEGPTLPEVLGRLEPPDNPRRLKPPDNPRRLNFRTRFDALLCSNLASVEPHLRWAMGEVARAVAGHVPHARDVKGIDWVQLLDDLSIWDRGAQHRRRRDVRDIWAKHYLSLSASKERNS